MGTSKANLSLPHFPQVLKSSKLLEITMCPNRTNLRNGIRYSDGDGTVPLLSLGALCRGGWRGAELNPGGLQVVTREYMDSAGQSRFNFANPWHYLEALRRIGR